ncbi:hypothetical protein J2129_002108 [Methanofollis sp. W23]|uniref:hypothetical protein n=1 Tax=Methanofollis sp. W23 TaxID=2817849 RepID=UPI001AE515A8|nr:hypothetical protein [Methanofollis sp. W23]MBP2146654.1 hypothetical protein [Methanofollis sp. W23]
MTGIKTDIKKIKERTEVLTETIDELFHEKETTAMMKLSEQSVSAFLEDEPDLYTVRDVRVAYR